MQEKIQNEGKRAESSESDYGSSVVGKMEYKGEIFGEIPYYIGIGSWPSLYSDETTPAIKGPLTPLEVAAVVSIFEDAVDELIILKYVIGAPEIYCDLRYKTIEERYTRRLTPSRIFPEADSTPIFTSALKLERDRGAIETVFFRTTRSLTSDGNYDPLFDAVDVMQREEEEDRSLVEELKKNLLYLKDLKARVEEKRRLDDREEKERDELMYQLQDEMDDVLLKCEVEEKFVDKWETVRQAQNDLKLHQVENQLKENIAKYSTKIKLEKRVTYELQTYLKLSQAELEDQLEEWMATYDTEMERRENKIIHLKYSRDQAEEKKHQLRDLYAQRCTEMKDWVAFRDLRNMRIGASLVIQSWWRGMMVRKRLGPYKPKKEKGAKKKK